MIRWSAVQPKSIPVTLHFWHSNMAEESIIMIDQMAKDVRELKRRLVKVMNVLPLFHIWSGMNVFLWTKWQVLVEWLSCPSYHVNLEFKFVAIWGDTLFCASSYEFEWDILSYTIKIFVSFASWCTSTDSLEQFFEFCIRLSCAMDLKIPIFRSVS